MFRLKIFVRVQTFRRGPPVPPHNFCHPEVEEPIFGRLGVRGCTIIPALPWPISMQADDLRRSTQPLPWPVVPFWRCLTAYIPKFGFGCFCTSAMAADLIKSTLPVVPLPMLPTLKKESCLGSIPGCPAETNMSARLPLPSQLYFIIVRQNWSNMK